MTTYDASGASNAMAQATTILVVEEDLGDFGLIKSCLQRAGFKMPHSGYFRSLR